MHYGSLRAAIQRLPMMMALGMGLSINNALAVAEGLFRRNAEFIRTPKHGITLRTENWATKKYRSRPTMHCLLELAFGIYLVFTVGMAVFIGAWPNVPFLFLFMMGFLYVGVLSLYQGRSGSPTSVAQPVTIAQRSSPVL